MKKAGLVILVIGVLISFFSGISFDSEEQVAEEESYEVTADDTDRSNWIPMVGVAVMTVGGIVFILGGKEG